MTRPRTTAKSCFAVVRIQHARSEGTAGSRIQLVVAAFSATWTFSLFSVFSVFSVFWLF